MKINQWNLLTWDDDGSPPATCTDEYVMPVYLGDVIKFYINFDSPLSDISNYKLGIWIPSGIVIYDVATINKDYIDVSYFNVYCQWTVGVMPKPFFRFVIYDTSASNTIVYWSNPFRYVKSKENTTFLKYRNEFNGINFQYESVASFYNQFRIDCLVRENRPTVENDGHVLSDGRFNIAYSRFREKTKFYCTMIDRYFAKGMYHAINCTDIYFDNIRYAKSQGDQPSYETRQNDNTPLYNLSFELDVYESIVTASNT